MFKRICAQVICILFIVTIASAQSTDRDMEKEQEIWKRLEAVAPKALEDFKAATEAMDIGDYEEAVRLYQNVVDRAPEFDPALRRLGGSLVALGRAREGISFQEKAVEKNRSSENLISLAQSLAYPGENVEGSPAEKTRALELAKAANHLHRGNDPSYPLLVAQLSIDLNREDDFRNVV